MSSMIRWSNVMALVAVLLSTSGIASAQRAPDDRDPWEGFNRGVYSFNQGLDKVIIHPVSKGYNWILPKPVRTGVSNFFDNLGDVVTVANDLLQGKFQQGLEDSSRVVWNTTLGIGGLFDPATSMGIPRHQEDFGQTLGVWFGREKHGPFLMLPVLGASSVRDGVGLVGDIYTWPVFWVPVSARVSWGLAGVAYIDTRAELLETENLLDTAALDRYAFLRDSYFQHRRELIYDGNVPEDEDETFEDDFEPDPEPGTDAEAGPAGISSGASINRR